MIFVIFIVDSYIKSKDNKLRSEIYNKIDSIFEHREQYVDVAYSNYNVKYEKISIPLRPLFYYIKGNGNENSLNDFERRSLDRWNDNYGNVSKLYRIHYKSSDWSNPVAFEDG